MWPDDAVPLGRGVAPGVSVPRLSSSLSLTVPVASLSHSLKVKPSLPAPLRHWPWLSWGRSHSHRCPQVAWQVWAGHLWWILVRDSRQACTGLDASDLSPSKMPGFLPFCLFPSLPTLPLRKLCPLWRHRPLI